MGAARLEPNTDEAMEAGVFGFPFYIVNGEKFWGQDRLADLDDHLTDIA
jgi:2-hydroxychromene-2-carboxylate isomerase